MSQWESGGAHALLKYSFCLTNHYALAFTGGNNSRLSLGSSQKHEWSSKKQATDGAYPCQQAETGSIACSRTGEIT